MWVAICLILAGSIGLTFAVTMFVLLWWHLGWLKWPRWLVILLLWYLGWQELLVSLLAIALFAHILVFR